MTDNQNEQETTQETTQETVRTDQQGRAIKDRAWFDQMLTEEQEYFSGVAFVGVDFSGSEIRSKDFYNVSFDGCRFRDSTRWHFCRFNMCLFQNVKASEADFTRCAWDDDCRFDDYCSFKYCRFDLAQLAYAGLHGISFYGSSFIGANLMYAHMGDTELGNVNFRGAYLAHTVFGDANFDSTNFDVISSILASHATAEIHFMLAGDMLMHPTLCYSDFLRLWRHLPVPVLQWVVDTMRSYQPVFARIRDIAHAVAKLGVNMEAYGVSYEPHQEAQADEPSEELPF